MEAVPPSTPSFWDRPGEVEAGPADHDAEVIAWTFSLSPEERLDVLQEFVEAFWTPAHG